jgi:hypothetical protein
MKYLDVCGELHRQGYMTDEEIKKDYAYAKKTYSKKIRKIYCIIIMPVVLLMRRSKLFTEVVYWITKRIWLKRALR